MTLRYSNVEANILALASLIYNITTLAWGSKHSASFARAVKIKSLSKKESKYRKFGAALDVEPLHANIGAKNKRHRRYPTSKHLHMLLLVFIPSYCYHKRSEQERSVCNNYWDGPRWEPKEKARPHAGEGRVFGASCDGMRLSLSRAQWERKNHLQWHNI